jgi:hypothetical protein
MGVGNGEVAPAGNQQQQPLQSVHDALDLSGLHTELHVEAPEELPEEDPLDPLLLPEEPLDELLWLAPLSIEPWLAPLSAGPPWLAPLSAEPLLPLLPEPLLPELLPLLVEPLLVEPLLPPLVEPLELPPLAEPPLLPLMAPPESVSAGSPEVDPPSSLEPAVVPPLPLLQAARPTVDEAPMTTTTWNSLSIFMAAVYRVERPETLSA